MNTFPIRLLQCPKCIGRLDLYLYAFNPHYGLLRCYCGTEYPVVFSIPVFRNFPEATEVLRLIREHDMRSALLTTLISLSDLRKQGKPSTPELEKLIEDPFTTLRQTLDLLCEPPTATREFHRTGRVSTITGTALLQLVADKEVDALHLGCGIGHVERLAALSIRPNRWIGADASFSLLFVARKFMAPECHFLCYDPEGQSPFRNTGFDLVLSETPPPPDPVPLLKPHQGILLLPEVRGTNPWEKTLRSKPVHSFPLKSLLAKIIREGSLDLTQEEGASSDASIVMTTQKLPPKTDLSRLLARRSPRPVPLYEQTEDGDTLNLVRKADPAPGIPDPLLVEMGAFPPQVSINKALLREIQDTIPPNALPLFLQGVLADLPLDYA